MDPKLCFPWPTEVWFLFCVFICKLLTLPFPPLPSPQGALQGHTDFVVSAGTSEWKGHYRSSGPTLCSKQGELQIKKMLLRLCPAQGKVAQSLSGHPGPSQKVTHFLVLARYTRSALRRPACHLAEIPKVRHILPKRRMSDLDLRSLQSVSKKKVLLKVNCVPFLSPDYRGNSPQNCYVTLRERFFPRFRGLNLGQKRVRH